MIVDYSAKQDGCACDSGMYRKRGEVDVFWELSKYPCQEGVFIYARVFNNTCWFVT